MIVHSPEYVAARAATYKAKARERKAALPKVEITSERLNELFTYSVVTGQLIRKVTINYKALAGQLVDFKHNAGYSSVAVDGVRLLVHRVIWCMVTGSWPTEILDHIDGNRSNNIWTNLRSATRAENNRNGLGWQKSKSGLKGVYPAKAANRWEAKITVNSKSKSLGTYDSIHEAKEAYNRAAIYHYRDFAKL
jgi:hypothetical protein